MQPEINMNELYSDLASIYEAMYATFIDYKLEYEFYSKILKRYTQKRILEIGSGTGNLTAYFEKNGFEYVGLELSLEMLKIAKQKNPNSIFINDDMRSFKYEKLVSAIIMTGRTISYLCSNDDVNSTLISVHNNLEKGGVFCFDFIDANRFVPEIYYGKEVIHEAVHNEIHYLRKSIWSINLTQGMAFDWSSIYFRKTENGLVEIGKDHSTIRTFTKDELKIFLEVNNFSVKEIIEKESYAFPTYVIVAQKK